MASHMALLPWFCRQPSNKDAANRTWKRGKQGFYKSNNGLLDVTPIGDELAICPKNSQRSALLRLPLDIRTMIWEYVLESGEIIKLFPIACVRHSKIPKPTHRFQLLRVCRQIYVEAALLPYTLNTFSFVDVGDYARSFNNGLRQIKHVKFSTSERGLRMSVPEIPGLFESLESLEIHVHNASPPYFYAQWKQALTLEHLRREFEGKNLSVHFISNYHEWIKHWSPSYSHKKKVSCQCSTVGFPQTHHIIIKGKKSK
ncbi:hypothetical protein GQ44DRAFT_755879 [Phaeosphaeriaceae sp. PMI808]|nr:hypothetical protein GQ44DRAFT_755879 [Phaeosphaeriaceae sp. PMI808]